MGNWNVDIAGELGDYLGDLEEITFTFDGGSTNLNFAEAALLIQGGVWKWVVLRPHVGVAVTCARGCIDRTWVAQ